MVYKAEYDEKGRKKLFVRLYSGELRIRECVDIHNKESVRIKSLYRLHNGAVETCETVGASDIAVLTDMEMLSCGDILGIPSKLRKFTPAEPLLSASVIPAQGFDRYALISALKILNTEDPSLGLFINSTTEEIMLRLYGKLQTEVIQNILSERFGIESVFSPVRTLFKAQPKRECFAEIRIGRTFFPAGIALSITPLPVGSGFVYDNQVDYGYLEKPFQNAVLEGILKGLAEGLGNEIVDVKVTFLDADYDSVCGTPAAFRSLAPLVVKKALEIVGTKRVEPWQKFELLCPAEYEKRVVSDLIALRAEINDISHGNEIEIVGLIPLDSSKDYSADLLIKTGGKGVFFTEFYGYR